MRLKAIGKEKIRKEEKEKNSIHFRHSQYKYLVNIMSAGCVGNPNLDSRGSGSRFNINHLGELLYVQKILSIFIKQVAI